MNLPIQTHAFLFKGWFQILSFLFLDIVLGWEHAWRMCELLLSQY